VDDCACSLREEISARFNVSLVGEQSRVKMMTHRKHFQTRSLSVSLCIYIERRTLQNERKGSRDGDEKDEDEDMNGFIPHHSDLCVLVCKCVNRIKKEDFVLFDELKNTKKIKVEQRA
jgi:hypothetical protein